MKTLLAAVYLAAMSIVVFAESNAAVSFTTMKSLAGDWEGAITTVPADPSVQGKSARVTIRVTSLGNAVLHEMKVEGRPDDPITMFYVEQDQLRLTHYCDAGNRPRMNGKTSADGKGVEFSLLDLSGGTENGHMHNAAFTPIDPDHHVEEWTYMLGEGRHVVAHFDLHRKK